MVAAGYMLGDVRNASSSTQNFKYKMRISELPYITWYL